MLESKGVYYPTMQSVATLTHNLIWRYDPQKLHPQSSIVIRAETSWLQIEHCLLGIVVSIVKMSKDAMSPCDANYA